MPIHQETRGETEVHMNVWDELTPELRERLLESQRRVLAEWVERGTLLYDPTIASWSEPIP